MAAIATQEPTRPTERDLTRFSSMLPEDLQFAILREAAAPAQYYLTFQEWVIMKNPRMDQTLIITRDEPGDSASPRLPKNGGKAWRRGANDEEIAELRRIADEKYAAWLAEDSEDSGEEQEASGEDSGEEQEASDEEASDEEA